MILDFTKGVAEILPDFPKLLVLQLFDQHHHAEGFLTHYGDMEAIPPDFCRNVEHGLDIHQHVIKQKHLKDRLTEFDLHSAYREDRNQTNWDRTWWFIQVLNTGGKWRVSLGLMPGYPDDSEPRADVSFLLPDYDPHCPDTVEPWEEPVRVSAWDLLLRDDSCPTE